MGVNNNPVQDYIEELNKVKIPIPEINILDFLTTLNTQHQKEYLSFILSQSHIFNSIKCVVDAQTHVAFYSSTYSDYESVPMLDKDAGRIQHVELSSLYATNKSCKKILDSLQGDDKTEWTKFVQYVKSIYELNKMDTRLNPLYEEYLKDVASLKAKVFQKKVEKDGLKRDNNVPAVQEKGIFSRIKAFFLNKKKTKDNKKEELIPQDDNISPKDAALALIRKYKDNPNLSMLMRNQLDYAGSLIRADLSDEDFKKVIIGIERCKENNSYDIHTIFDMLKQLSANAQIGKELYSPEILMIILKDNLTQIIQEWKKGV